MAAPAPTPAPCPARQLTLELPCETNHSCPQTSLGFLRNYLFSDNSLDLSASPHFNFSLSTSHFKIPCSSQPPSAAIFHMLPPKEIPHLEHRSHFSPLFGLWLNSTDQKASLCSLQAPPHPLAHHHVTAALSIRGQPPETVTPDGSRASLTDGWMDAWM